MVQYIHGSVVPFGKRVISLISYDDFGYLPDLVIASMAGDLSSRVNALQI